MNDDRWLQELLTEEEPPDAGFSALLATRLERHRRRRRHLAWSLTALLSLLLLALLPVLGSSLLASALASTPSPSWSYLALVLGAGLCAVLWLDTESYGAPDQPW